MAVFFRHNGADMHATILALTILIGCAFLGFFEPRFRTPSLLNPNAKTSVARRVWLFVHSVAF
jgi:hypothetical protein